MGLNLLCKSMVYQVLMQTFNGFYECKKQPADFDVTPKSWTVNIIKRQL